MKDVLLDWMSEKLKSDVSVNRGNYHEYLSNPESILMPVIEADWRHEIFDLYLSNPVDETVINYLTEKAKYDPLNPLYNAEKRVLKKLLVKFRLYDIQVR